LELKIFDFKTTEKAFNPPTDKKSLAIHPRLIENTGYPLFTGTAGPF
jgi:hypothetical protein